jgi:hypothetical protein
MKNLGEEFVWWYGVVEDRADPLELGRVRVRCYGWHTDDLKELPTKDLPWAQPIQPITSAANSGIGRSATGLLEGTWVVGFFADGKEAQRPVIMGSLAGIPTEMTTNGFSDPKGNYPTLDSLFQPDTPRLARNGIVAESDASLIAKRNNRLRDVPTATAPDLASLRSRYGTSDTYQKGAVGPTVGADADYAEDSEGEDTTPYWHEPNARYGGEGPQREEGPASSYPYNHVYRSESGHVFEIDDTPGIGRIHQYHNAGTFEEIQSDGTRVTKVVGKNYEVVVSDENIYIQGTQNITVKGNAKLYIQGDHYTEVDGNQYVTVRGDRVTKIQGNDLKEVLTDENTQINGKKAERVSGDRRSTVDGNYTEIVGKEKKTTIKYSEAKTVQINSKLTVSGNTQIISIKNIDFAAAGNMSIANGGTFKHTSTGAANEEFQSTSSMTFTGAATRKYNAKSSIDYNGDAHIRYDQAYYKHVGGDTYTWIADNFDDHTNATGPIGRTGINDTTNSTVDNL